MAHGTADYYSPRTDFVTMLAKLDDLDGTMDGVITLDELNSAACEILGKLAGIDTSVTTGGDLINKLDALDGTMDGRLTLAQLEGVDHHNMRPKYGAADSAEGNPVVPSNLETELVSVSGKGMIYGGCIYMDYTSTQKNSRAKIYVDGTCIANMSFGDMYLHSIEHERSYPFYLLRQDEVKFIYSVGLSGNITFEDSFMLTYHEWHGTTPQVFYQVIYALI